MANLKQQLTAFAQRIGSDIKQLTQEVNALKGSQPSLDETALTAKFDEFRQQLFGGNLDEAYDTFKEIGDKLKALDGSIGQAITQKLTEIRQELATFNTEFTELKNQFEAITSTNLVDIYNKAKGA